jgi:hypothetical protein
MSSDPSGYTRTCEWPIGRPCTRPATIVLEWGDFHVCAGHRIVADAYRASYCELAITSEEYGERMERAMRWFRENPAPSDKQPINEGCNA